VILAKLQVTRNSSRDVKCCCKFLYARDRGYSFCALIPSRSHPSRFADQSELIGVQNKFILHRRTFSETSLHEGTFLVKGSRTLLFDEIPSIRYRRQMRRICVNIEILETTSKCFTFPHTRTQTHTC